MEADGRFQHSTDPSSSCGQRAACHLILHLLLLNCLFFTLIYIRAWHAVQVWEGPPPSCKAFLNLGQLRSDDVTLPCHCLPWLLRPDAPPVWQPLLFSWVSASLFLGQDPAGKRIRLSRRKIPDIFNQKQASCPVELLVDR